MRIFRVIGLGLAIVMMHTLIPKIFSGFEATLLGLFDFMQTAFVVGGSMLEQNRF
jgi:hypothetical protein